MSNVIITEQIDDLPEWAQQAMAEGRLIAECFERIDWLKKQLNQLANFNPDWDMLKATQDSLREHMQELADLEQAYKDRTDVADSAMLSVEVHIETINRLQAERDALQREYDALVNEWNEAEELKSEDRSIIWRNAKLLARNMELRSALASTHFHHKKLLPGCPECDKHLP